MDSPNSNTDSNVGIGQSQGELTYLGDDDVPSGQDSDRMDGDSVACGDTDYYPPSKVTPLFFAIHMDAIYIYFILCCMGESVIVALHCVVAASSRTADARRRQAGHKSSLWARTTLGVSFAAT